jgi:hypothetical protein
MSACADAGHRLCAFSPSREGRTLIDTPQTRILRKRTWQPITLAPEGPARPCWTLTPSSGECDLSMNPTQAERTSSKLRYCFYPRERLTVEHANSIGFGKVQVSYLSTLAHGGGIGNSLGCAWPKQATWLSSPYLKAGGLSWDFASLSREGSRSHPVWFVSSASRQCPDQSRRLGLGPEPQESACLCQCAVRITCRRAVWAPSI